MTQHAPPPRTGFAPADSKGSALQNLDRRSREIFRRIVDSYLETGEPVGSRNISKLLPVSLSPASVRNVMADLEQLGLIYAPHTSAGRLPTEIGLRFFVDALLEVGDLSVDERRDIEARLMAFDKGRSVDSVLAEASQALSGLSRGAGVVLAGKADLRLKHIEFIRLEPTRGLVVLVGEDGSVENRLVDLDPGTTPSTLIEASNYLNTHLRGRTLSDAKSELERRAAESTERGARVPRVTSGQADLLARTLDQMHRELGLEARPQRLRDGEASQPIAAGDRVHVSSWEQDGTMLEDLGENALVQIGAMRMTVPKSDLRRRGGNVTKNLPPDRSKGQGDRGGETTLETASTAQTQIDVRGKRFVEAEPIVDRWIDDAILVGHSPLRLIHGKGTGLLGKGLQQYLKAHPFVQNVRYGNADEGGGGVTVFELRSPTA